MSDPSSDPEFMTTAEVASLLRIKARKVYDLAATGGIPCRRVTGKLLFPRDDIAEWLAGGKVTQTAGVARPPVVAGSHDPLLDWAIRESGAGLSTAFDGSSDGLIRLADGQALAAGLHLFDPETEGWNVARAKVEFSDTPLVLVEWAKRSRGIILSREISGVRSLEELKGRTLARRQPGAGGAILFDHLVSEAHLNPEDFAFTRSIARTETDAATAVAIGEADAAPGLLAVARQFNLPFLPLMQERFDLLVDRRSWFEPPMQALLAYTKTQEFAEKAAALEGYDISGLGMVHWNGAG